MTNAEMLRLEAARILAQPQMASIAHKTFDDYVEKVLRLARAIENGAKA